MFATTFNGYEISSAEVVCVAMQAAMAAFTFFMGAWLDGLFHSTLALSSFVIAYYRSKSDWLEARTAARPEVSNAKP